MSGGVGTSSSLLRAPHHLSTSTFLRRPCISTRSAFISSAPLWPLQQEPALLSSAGTLGVPVLMINYVAAPPQRPMVIGFWMGVFM